MSTIQRCPSNISQASPTLQGSLKDGFGETVLAFDMLEPCEFPSLDSCQERLLWTHKEVDLPPHPAIGLVLQVGNAETFPRALGFESLYCFLGVSKQGLCCKAKKEDGGDRRHAQSEPAWGNEIFLTKVRLPVSVEPKACQNDIVTAIYDLKKNKQA